jgi:alginate O-acetyltransferase complex protein AlgI
VRFVPLLLQLAALLIVFRLYTVDEEGFLKTAAMCVAAFAVHYWLPFAWKEPWWIGASLAGGAAIVGPQVLGLLLSIGLALYVVAASPLRYSVKLAVVLVIAAALVYGRATFAWGIPVRFWPVFGAIFMFRYAIYLYDVRFMQERPTLREFAAYFFPLPNFYFLLFPVIDLQTLRRTYYQRDIHDIAQQGITWITRGAVQLVLYRIISELKPPFSPAAVTSPTALVVAIASVYLLYLRVSGHFHVIVGLLHLFGYDLPETHRRYLLASSLTDFWRRINIYWKDFMVKLVYFPVYFRLRRKGETLAQVIATVSVFIATWALHSYQWFWFRGEWLFSWPDTLFWGVLGCCVVVNVLAEQRRPRRTLRPARWRQIVGVGLTLPFIAVLWSLWQSPTLSEWLDVMTWWRIG